MINNFTFLEFINYFKALTGAKNEHDIAEKLGIKQNTFSVRKKKGEIPYKELIIFLMRKGFSIDAFLKGQLSEQKESRMVEKVMREVKVHTLESGVISIEQPMYGHEDAVVIIHPDQVDLLIQWLKECKENSIKEKEDKKVKKISNGQ